MPDKTLEVKKSPPARAAVPDAWRSLRSEMDRFFDRFDRGFGLPSLRPMFDLGSLWPSETSFAINAPAVDVTEDEKAYKITAELPGLDEKDIEISLSPDGLVLKGEKQQEKEQKGKNYHLSERSYGAFQRAFRLPEGVDQTKVAASFAKGVLTITLPRSPSAQRQQKKVPIKSA